MRVRAEGLVRVFAGPPPRRALDGATLDLGEPGIHALIGPNGSGKTTLLRILALLERPDAGAVLFDERPAAPTPRDRRRVTMVFDRPGLLRGTVRWNLRFALRAHGVPRTDVDRRIAEVAKPMELERILDARVDRISAGEARRAAVARALTLRTDLLLLDEPTANLDPLSTALLEAAARGAADRPGTTIVIATHDLHLARRLASNVHFLVDGVVRGVGPSAEVLNAPASRELAEFVGVENLFRGAVEDRGDRQVFVGDGPGFAVAAERSGPALAGVSARDVLVSREEIRSSAMN
ncbi:MAG: ATP-binding cassette domain-containing protein, partial [Myxococcota bacterium]|nr:ATP-binding cassette domain-containing protein [Myxococcota bacterium]